MPQIVNVTHPIFVPSRDGTGAPTAVGDFTAEELRRTLDAAHGASGGTLRVGDLVVSPLGTPGAQVTVAPGRAWIPNAFSSNAGKYLVISNSTVTLDIPAHSARFRVAAASDISTTRSTSLVLTSATRLPPRTRSRR